MSHDNIIDALIFIVNYYDVVYSVEKGIIIDQTFMTTDIYQDGVTYNIVSFTYDESVPSPDMYEEDNVTEPEQNIKIGIVSSGNILVDLPGNTKAYPMKSKIILFSLLNLLT